MTKRRQAVGTDAQAAIEDLEKQAQQRHLSPEERARRQQQAQRVRGRYDIPKAIKDQVETIGKQYGISASAAAGALLGYALNLYNAGDISLDNLDKELSPSPLYDFKVESEEIVNVLEGRRDLQG